MERVGIFGTLTVGFLASAAMAILGLLLYSYASLRDRVYRFSVLHAANKLRGIRAAICHDTYSLHTRASSTTT